MALEADRAPQKTSLRRGGDYGTWRADPLAAVIVRRLTCPRRTSRQDPLQRRRAPIGACRLRRDPVSTGWLKLSESQDQRPARSVRTLTFTAASTLAPKCKATSNRELAAIFAKRRGTLLTPQQRLFFCYLAARGSEHETTATVFCRHPGCDVERRRLQRRLGRQPRGS